MYYRDPRLPVPAGNRLGERVERHKDHPLMLEVLGDADRIQLAAALDFQAQLQAEAEEQARETQLEAAADAKRGFFGKLAYKAFDLGVVFLFGQVPDAVSAGLGWIIEQSEKRKKQR